MAWNAYKETLVININSSYDGWVDDIEDMLKHLGKKETIIKSNPSVDPHDLEKRASELKYVILVDSLMDILCVNNTQKDRNWDDIIKEVPLFDEDDEWDEGDLIEKPEIKKNESICLYYNKEEEDHYYIANYYGVYTTSVQLILDKLAKKSGLILKDGPAVILCPENIIKLYPSIINSCKLKKERIQLGLFENPILTSLKLILYHEIGHHFYPVLKKTGSKLVSEAFANWFVFQLIDYNEKRILYHKTLTQNYDYRAYNGIIALCIPQSFNYINSSSKFKISHYSVKRKMYHEFHPIEQFENYAFYGFKDKSMINHIEELLLDYDEHFYYKRVPYSVELILGVELLKDLFKNIPYGIQDVVNSKQLSYLKTRRWHEKLWATNIR